MENIIKYNNNKFKSIFISVNFLMPLRSEDLTKNMLFSMILKKINKKYSTEKEIEKKLLELYNAKLFVDVQKFDKYSNVCFNIKFINKKYIGEDVSKELIELLKELIINVDVNNKKFDEILVQREKQTLKDKINELKDDQRSYALSKIEELLFKDEDYGYPLSGKIEDVEKIDGKSLYEHYLKIINTASVCVVVSGNLEDYENIGEEIFKKLNIKKTKLELSFNNEENQGEKIEEACEIVFEKRETSQSVLSMGIKTDICSYKEFYPAVILNVILGGTPASRMFQNIREKESLAYFAKSNFDINKKVIYITAGIDYEVYEKAKSLIIEQVEDLKNGNIKKDEIKIAKEYVKAIYKDFQDSNEIIVKQILQRKLSLAEDVDFKKILKSIDKVSSKDILKVASKIKIKEIFLLGGTKNV